MKHRIFLSLILCLALALPLCAGAVYIETSWSMNIDEIPQIQITYPLTGILAIDQKLTSYYFDWLADVRGMAVEDEQLKEENSFGPEYDDSWGSYALTAEQFAAEDTISFIFTEDYNRYAAVHPSTGYTAKTFRLSTGEQISLESLIHAGQWEALIAKVKAALYLDEVISDWGNTQGNWLDEGLSAVGALDAFALTDEALMIQFQQYDIAPYALGAARIRIPLTDLAGILR